MAGSGKGHAGSGKAARASYQVQSASTRKRSTGFCSFLQYAYCQKPVGDCDATYSAIGYFWLSTSIYVVTMYVTEICTSLRAIGVWQTAVKSAYQTSVL